MTSAGRTALVAGSTGLIGRHLVKFLSSSPHYGKIIQLARKKSDHLLPKVEEHILDFENMEPAMKNIQAEDVFCCLGTTMKQAGSKEAFRKVDYDYVVNLGEVMCRNGSGQFLVVSSMGANPSSSVFYNRVKGEMESAVKNIPFPTINIFRPSLLLGEREESRSGEKLAIVLFKTFKFMMVGRLRKYRAIEASRVAEAMVKIATSHGDGIFTYESEMIFRI